MKEEKSIVKTGEAIEISSSLTSFTTQIVSAHISHNKIDAEALLDLIKQVHSCLAKLTKERENVTPLTLTPAVPIGKSVKPGYIICLEDGKKLKLLKRHLKSTYNMTPEEYRQRWGLKPDYPMVASEYAEKRSALAKTFGLGRSSLRAKAKRITKKLAAR